MNERAPAETTKVSTAPAAGTCLAGIRVLDMTRVLAGPFCGQVLADLGAEVIKVERPEVGDDSRAWGPPYVSSLTGDASESVFYCSFNRGKRSIAIDISKPEGAAIIRDLASTADVLIENYKVGTLDRYGLGYAELSKRSPRLVYCSITGFGHTGPYRMRPGYDTIIQGLGGLMSITGKTDDEPGGGPVKAGIAVADLTTGLYSAIAILAALRYREASGIGQHIDMSLLDVQVASLANVGMNYLVSGNVPNRVGNRLPTVYPSDSFLCSDGYLMLIVGNNEQFKRFCTCVGLEELAGDARFCTNELRLRNASELGAKIREVLVSRGVAEWLMLLERAGIPCGPINDIAQVFENPQVRERGMKRELDHSAVGRIPTIANPIRLSASPVKYDLAPPTLGQHTRHVLNDLLGLSAADLEELAAKRVI